MTTITTVLAGCNFRPAEARDLIKSAGIGDSFTLEADPTNQYDSQAVKVLYKDVFVGFVAKQDNGPIFLALQDGHELSGEIIGFESSIKPLLEIELPE
jgi:hypothetical protein